MNKYVLIFLFLLGATTVMGQKKDIVIGKTKPVANAKKKSIVQLISSETAEYSKDAAGKTIGKVHKGVFKQDYSTLTSDSAYFYPDQNMVDAFGHVNINQGDTLNIFSDKLHYDGNTKLAILTDHVKMIDKDATLTTNYLTYNTATRYATYTGGGKMVNKDNTLISKNGYYFTYSRDAYFRYDVVCTTPDAVIKTDTLRYNNGTRIAYFYGPTHIYGTKDKDTLYTENGDYNTVNEQARFGKKNLYSQGTKSLKGDSLFYDRLKGYGRAVKNITFNDNEQKMTLKGNLGEFYKNEDRAVITQNAYMILVTEEKDTTQTDSTAKVKADALGKRAPLQNKADSATIKRLGLTPAPKPTTDSVTIKRLGLTSPSKPKTDSVTIRRLGLLPPPKTTTPAIKKPNAPAAKVKNEILPKKKDESVTAKPIIKFPDERIKRDSLFLGADTLETQILTYKDLKLLKLQRFETSHRDTSIKVIHTVMLTKPLKVITMTAPKLPEDSVLLHPYFFGKPAPKPVIKKKPLSAAAQKKFTLDSIKNKRTADSLQKVADHGLTDTSRIRIISGHHHAKIYKSDLQAKADSMFFSYSDSTIRMFVKPMIWTQGSQLSGDSINLQMKNKKLDNMDMYPSAFIANIEKGDSVHFNQVSGKTMHGTFRDNKLSTIRVIGNAETIAFNRDSVTHKVTEMQRSVSGSLMAILKNGEIKRGAFYTKHESRVDPINLVKEEDRLLKTFIWKPKDRPASKQDILSAYKPPLVKKPVVLKGGPVKGTIPIKDKTPGNKKPGVTTKQAAGAATVSKSVKDSVVLRSDTSKKRDTSKRMITPQLKPGI